MCVSYKHAWYATLVCILHMYFMQSINKNEEKGGRNKRDRHCMFVIIIGLRCLQLLVITYVGDCRAFSAPDVVLSCVLNVHLGSCYLVCTIKSRPQGAPHCNSKACYRSIDKSTGFFTNWSSQTLGIHCTPCQ